jgi:hypothetical protein
VCGGGGGRDGEGLGPSVPSIQTRKPGTLVRSRNTSQVTEEIKWSLNLLKMFTTSNQKSTTLKPAASF